MVPTLTFKLVMLNASYVLLVNLLVLIHRHNAMNASLVRMPLNLAHLAVLTALLAPILRVKLALISVAHYALLVRINLPLVALAVLPVPMVQLLMPLVLLPARLVLPVHTLMPSL